MAKTENKSSESEGAKQAVETKMYKLSGTRNVGEVVDRILIEGSSHSPEVYIDSENAAPLTEDQVENYRKKGYKLTEVSEEKVVQSTDEPKTAAQQQAAQTPNPGNVSTGNIKS